MADPPGTCGGRLLKPALAAVLLLGSAPAAADPVDRWATEIARASSRFAIPEAWIRRVIRAESGGNPLVGGRPTVSSAGAMGLMQLMPGTWRDMRLALGLGPNPHDPRDNILAGTAYLRLMYDRFGYPGLFAAYHAGPARYAAVLAGRRALPAETRAYVAALAPVTRPSPDRPRGGIFALEPNPAPAAAADVRAGQSASAGLFVALGGEAPD